MAAFAHKQAGSGEAVAARRSRQDGARAERAERVSEIDEHPQLRVDFGRIAVRTPLKATVGRHDDALEVEADRVAEIVSRRAIPAIGGGGDIALRTLVAGKMSSSRRAAMPDTSAVLDLAGALGAAGRGGAPLTAETRSYFEPRFGHNFGEVRIHADGQAARAARGVRARAYTVGRDVVFGQGEYRPATAGGRRLIAHELAHVVQQTGSGMVARTIQRFDAGEHKGIGDAAAEGRMVSLAPGLMVSYGDVVALAGDLFGDWQTLVKLANTEGITEGTRGEVVYALQARVRTSAEGTSRAAAEKAGMGKLFDEKAKAAVERRYADLALHNISHFPNPRKGDAARSQAEKDSGPDAIGGGASYRRAHGEAMTVAAAIGQAKGASHLATPKPVGITHAKDGLDGALVLEAFADHFLTDAFSAGHQPTERASIQDYWNAKYPQLWKNLQGWLADFVTIELRQHPKSTATRIGRKLAQRFESEEFALPEVEKAFAKIPQVGFGDIVAGAVHGFFNTHGALVDVGGKRITLAGDSHLLGKASGGSRAVTAEGADTFDAAKAAVQAGIAEVYRAFELGRKGEDPTMVPMKILKEEQGTLGAEKLMPQLVPDAQVTDPLQKSPKWEVASLAELVKDPRMLEGLSQSLSDYAGVVESSLSSLSKENMDAVKTVLIVPMKGGPQAVAELLKQVLEWKPIKGGGFDPGVLNDMNEMMGSSGMRR